MTALATRRAVVGGVAAIGAMAPAEAFVRDPLVALVDERRALLAAADAGDLDVDGVDDLLNRVAELDARIAMTPACTMRGAVAALELAEHECAVHHESPFMLALIAGALAMARGTS